METTPPSHQKLSKTKPKVSPLTVHRQSLQTGVFEFIPLPFILGFTSEVRGLV